MTRRPEIHWPWGRTRQLTPPAIPWSSSAGGRVRVLLECPPEKSPAIVANVLERDGFDVVVCEGPARDERCPLAMGEQCATVHSVDVVLNMLNPRRPEQAEVLPAIATSGPRPPALVAVSVAGGADPGLPGVVTVGHRSSSGEIVTAIRRALDERTRPSSLWGHGS